MVKQRANKGRRGRVGGATSSRRLEGARGAALREEESGSGESRASWRENCGQERAAKGRVGAEDVLRAAGGTSCRLRYSLPLSAIASRGVSSTRALA